MPTFWLRIGVLAVLATSVVLGGIYVLRDSEPEPETVPIDFGDFYLSGREEFSICVDAVGDAQSTPAQIEAVREALSTALDRALQIASERLDSIPVEYSDLVFVEGCPKPRLLSKSLASERPFDRRFRLDMRNDMFVGGHGGGNLSIHREFVYFVDSDTYADAFGTAPYADATEEFGSNGGDVFIGMTTAIYLPEDADSRAIQDGFLVTRKLLSRDEIRALSTAPP